MRFATVPLLFLPLVLAGCSLNIVPDTYRFTASSVAGHVYGGQQPVVGAHVYLLAANNTGYGKASVSLLDPVKTGNPADSLGGYVLTDVNGFFTITGDYTCTAGQQVYALALGGNPGYGGANAASGMMAVVGNCPGGTFINTVPVIWINEVSTVAAAYSMSGYATDATHVSSPNTPLALAGIANAFAGATNLVGIVDGIARTSNVAGNASVPQQNIDTIANILAACVNSNGVSTTCSVLFASAKSNGSSGTAPTETATAAINIAHNPGSNVGVLYSILPSQVAFGPALNSQPNDFTLPLIYTGGGLNKPESIAVDAAGNVWVANYGATGLSKILSPSAGSGFAPNSPFTGGGLGISEGIAIDNFGNAWVANYSKNSLSKFNSTGIALSTAAGFTGAGLTAPAAIAFDPSGYAWVANSAIGGCLSRFTSTGSPVAGYTPGGGCSGVYSLAVDTGGNIWPVSNDRSTIIEIYGSTSPSVGTIEHGAIANGGITSPTSVAIDSSGNLWVSNGAKNSSSISEYNIGTGKAVTGPNGYTGGGINTPYAIAIDGGGSVWVANSAGPAGSLSEFSTSGAPISQSTGYDPAIASPYAIAIDGSGNIWVADQGGSTVVELLGIATPVVTPTVAALFAPYSPGLQP